jgi:hypothetical protein
LPILPIVKIKSTGIDDFEDAVIEFNENLFSENERINTSNILNEENRRK